jgi:hypothetical protein
VSAPCGVLSANDWEIKEVAEAALLLVAPARRSGKLDRPVKYRFFGRSNFFGHTGRSPGTRCRHTVAAVRVRSGRA